VGLLLGIVVYVSCMMFPLFGGDLTFFPNVFLYYSSGIWLGDIFIQGRGEAAIPLAIIIGLFACILTMIFYCYVFCKINAAFADKEAT